MSHLRLTIPACALALTLAATSMPGRAQQVAGGRRRPVRRAALPLDRPGVDVGPRLRPRRVRGEPGDLLRRHGARRRLEDHQQRHDLRGAAPGPGPDVDRRRRRLADESRPRLGRQRRIEQPPEHLVGRRRLQVHRRRQDLDAHGAQDLAATSTASLIDPREQQRRLVAATGPLCGPGGERGVFKTDRRRRDVDAGAEGRRRHRRQRARHGSRRQPTCSTPPPISGAARRAA